jgi:hypothetical protein
MTQRFAGRSGNDIMEWLVSADEIDDFREAALILKKRRSVGKTELFPLVFERLIELVELQSEERAKALLDGIMALLSYQADPDEITDGDPYWPSTIVLPADGSYTSMGDAFEHRFSGLKICGYSVGKTSDLNDDDRRDLLTNFLENRLNPKIVELFGDAYGEPNSLKRLMKMATVIASNCKNFKKRSNAGIYQFAIADYEGDLVFLKEHFFDPWQKGNPSLPWPNTKV